MAMHRTSTWTDALMISNDEAHCRQIVRTHARTFALASRFLPDEKRSAAFALYAFCRVADDLVDTGNKGEARDVSAQLAAYRMQLDEALTGRPSGPVFRELLRAAQRYEVPVGVLHELLDGVARDCAPTHYGTWAELSRYCEGVASSVGEMCTYVFGVAGDGSVRARALAHARTLGVAMQLTNILRDVGEDLARGRVYLPRSVMARHGVTRTTLDAGTVTPEYRAMMLELSALAREWYAQGRRGIPLLHGSARLAVATAARAYEGILDDLARNSFDNFGRRAHVSGPRKLMMVPRVWWELRTAPMP